jgi:mono/diheme cytochrome c family protein
MTGVDAMGKRRLSLFAYILVPILLSAGAATAQTPSSDSMTRGGELVGGRCFQCHTDSMFRDQRQDRRAWVATIYRMVGRGAQFTPDEINAMADYLGVALGPDTKPFWTQSK